MANSPSWNTARASAVGDAVTGGASACASVGAGALSLSDWRNSRNAEPTEAPSSGSRLGPNIRRPIPTITSKSGQWSPSIVLPAFFASLTSLHGDVNVHAWVDRAYHMVGASRGEDNVLLLARIHRQSL